MLEYLIGYLMLPNRINIQSKLQISPFKLHIDITTQEDNTLFYIIYFLISLNILLITLLFYKKNDKNIKHDNVGRVPITD